VSTQWRRILIALLFFASLNGCLLDGSLPDRSAPDELGFNYWYLQHLYIYPQELPAQTVIANKGDSLVQSGAEPPSTLTGMNSQNYFSVMSLYASLSDRFTRYVAPAKAAAETQRDTSTQVQGAIGVEIEWNLESDSCRLQMYLVYPDDPAEAAGIRVGDRIVAVNGVNLQSDQAGVNYNAATKDSLWLRFDLLRAGQSLHIEVKRGAVWVPTVFVDSSNTAPVIQIREFMRSSIKQGGTDLEFHKALLATQNKGVRVLDLRHNPGGEVGICLNMANEFLSIGKPIVHLIQHSFSGRGFARIDTVDYLAKAGGLATTASVVLAVDSSTASCAEIFTAAVKQNLGTRAMVVGSHTYGKAIGQSRWNTPAGGIAVITSIQIRTPDWTDYEHRGISADVVVDDSEIMAKSLELASDSGKTLARHSILPISEMPTPPRGGAWIQEN